MTSKRPPARSRILAAAAEVAQQTGPGNLSLEAVARRAGVSKGGLLYHFPSKARLMQGLVSDYMERFEDALDAATGGANGKGESLLAAYIRLSAAECAASQASASWTLAAMAEDPAFLSPIRAFKRKLLDRLKSETPDLDAVLLAYLALEGLRAMKLFDLDILQDEERERVREILAMQARNGAASRPG